MYTRHIASHIREALADTPVVFVRGARQSGKSTLVRALLPDGARYVTFDDEVARTTAELDMKTFVRSLPPGSVIDEVQRVPQLFPTIKLVVDEDRRPGRLLLTGSADVAAIPAVSESLAGRVEPLTLYPLSVGELLGRPSGFLDRLFAAEPLRPATLPVDRDFLLERVGVGGYPEATARTSDRRRRRWFDAYVETILQRDIDAISEVEGLANLPRLLALLATRAGNALNYAEAARTLQLPDTTVKRYLALLQATFLVDLLPAWSRNATVRLRKAPKVHLVDSGLAAALRGGGVTHGDLLRDGGLLETFVHGELRKLASWVDDPIQISHYREERGAEVDFVLERGPDRLVGLEVKATATPGKGDFRGLLRLQEVAGTAFHRGILLYTGEQLLPFGENQWAVPMGALWEW